MQVKKFEAPTIQEALEHIKRELGPEAIILQTKRNKKGFGLMNRGSVEVTAAVSDRAISRKSMVEKKLPDETKRRLQDQSADRQAEVYDKQLERALESRARKVQDQVELGGGMRSPQVRAAAERAAEKGIGITGKAPARARSITATRYVDIDPGERSRDPEPASEGGRGLVGGQRIAGAVARSSASLSIEEEVRSLKRMLAEMKTTQDETQVPSSVRAGVLTGSLFTPALQEAFELLTMNGVEKKFAIQLVRKAGFELGEEKAHDSEHVVDQIAGEIMESVRIRSALEGLEPRTKTGSTGGPKVLALVGPTGVGKTTTIAKLASEAILKRNLKVGLVNLDSYKVAAFDQLATYAKILNVPFRSAKSVEDLRVAVADFKSLDLVIIDTTGRSQRDPGALAELKQLLETIPDLHTQLVLASTTRDAELYDTASRFGVFKPEGLILSKLDEATVFGAVYNVSHRAELPLAYFTTGQRVPEDIEEATPERVAALVMDL